MKKALISVTFFNFLAAGIGFLVNILLARFFPYEVFGRINLLLSFSAILIIVFEFGFNNSMVIFYNKYKVSELDKDLFRFVTKSYFRFLAIAFPVFLIILYLLNSYYRLSLLEWSFLISSTLFASIFRFFATYYQALGKWGKYNFLNVSYNLLKGLVLLIGGVLIYFVFKQKLEYETYLKLYVLYGILLLVVGIISSYKLIGVNHHRSYDLKDFKNLVLSLGISNIIIAFSMRLDNIIIESFLGLKSVAIYSAANTLALVFPLITGSITRVFMKEISKDTDYYLKKILEYQKKYMWMILFFTFAVIAFSPYLIDILYGGKYQDATKVFQILIVAYIGGLYFTPLESYFYNVNPNLILYVKATQLVVFIFMSLILIQVWSIYGVAVSVVVTRIIAWTYFSYLSIYKYGAKKIN